MFKEKLHNDIDRITPSAELLDRVSLMMKEEASRKKPKIYITAAKYGSIAAAVCLITAVAVILSNMAGTSAPQARDTSGNYDETVSDMNMMSFVAETAEETEMVSEETAAATQAAAPQAAGMLVEEADAGSYALFEADMVSEGYFLPCENGAYLLINDCMGAVVLNPDNNDNSMFDGFTVGDTVRVNHGYCLESYPGQTTIYSIEKIAEGELSDIPEDTLKQLEELGWIPLTDTREAE